MRPRVIVREVITMAWAASVSSVLIVIVAAAMSFAAIATVGRSAAASADVAARMEQAGSRRLSVIDGSSSGFINETTLSLVSKINTVEAAVALGAPIDVVNGATGLGGSRIPLWTVFGQLRQTGTLVAGRWPRAGEAIVTVNVQRRLRLVDPVGYLVAVDGADQYPIVGSFRPAAPFADLDSGALTVAEPGRAARELRAVISQITAARPTVASILAILAPPDPQSVTVESPTRLAETATDLAKQLSGYGRSLLGLILVVGGCFVASVVLADVLIRRRDLGRRRTLGITREDLILLVTARAGLCAAVGAVVGGALAWTLNGLTGPPTPLAFALSVAVLTCLAAGLASIPPAVFASRMDPVRVMRTP